jgi:hypothetical protein
MALIRPPNRMETGQEIGGSIDLPAKITDSITDGTFPPPPETHAPIGPIPRLAEL